MKALGRFIALEGGEGAGKSTQARLLAETLRQKAYDVELTREPGGTPGAEAIRDLLLAPPGEGWNAKAEALLFAAARADHVERVIRPALERGTWVVCDRFVASSRAYQGGVGGEGDAAIMELHEFGSGGLMPDRTLLLDVGEDELVKRIARRDGHVADAIAGRGADYHRDVARRFRELAQDTPDTSIVVDGSASPAIVHEKVMQALSSLLPEKSA